jgi:hypothetical protein
MSSKLASSNVQAIYYDKDADKTYLFATHTKEGFVGFVCDGPITQLDQPKVILDGINASIAEELTQLKSIEEASNARKAEEIRDAAGPATGDSGNETPQVGS